MLSTPPAAAPRRPVVDRALAEALRQEPLRLPLRRDCMAPDIPAGAAVEVVATRMPLPGDVVLYRHADGTLLAHRVIGYRRVAGRLHLLAQADAAAAADPSVPLAAVVGRVARVERGPGVWEPLPRRPLRAAARLVAFVAQRLRRR
jgi:hypothetical protein